MTVLLCLIWIVRLHALISYDWRVFWLLLFNFVILSMAVSGVVARFYLNQGFLHCCLVDSGVRSPACVVGQHEIFSDTDLTAKHDFYDQEKQGRACVYTV